jgi:hypothetical protein
MEEGWNLLDYPDDDVKAAAVEAVSCVNLMLYFVQSMEEVWNLLDYPDDDVKAAAVEAVSFFLIAYFKSGASKKMK